jgi:hypothetical protein
MLTNNQSSSPESAGVKYRDKISRKYIHIYKYIHLQMKRKSENSEVGLEPTTIKLALTATLKHT